jgi:hypothetical protein
MIRHHDGTKLGTAEKIPVESVHTQPAYDHDQLFASVAIFAGGGTAGARVYRVNLP